MAAENNKASLFHNLSVLIKLFSGPVTLLFLSQGLSEIDQGLFFSLLSIGALQIVFEMGVSTAFVQHLSVSLAGEANAAKSDAESNGYMMLSAYWCIGMALFFSASSFLLSIYIFNEVEKSLWLWQSTAYFVCISFNLAFNFVLIIREGQGDVDFVYKNKFFSAIVGVGFLWAGLASGFQMWAISLWQIGMLLPLLIHEKSWCTFQQVRSIRSYSLVTNFRSMLSFQWKLSLVWVTGYFYWNTPTLFLFKFVDPVFAGKFGLTFSLLNAINQVGQGWVVTNRVQIGRLVGLRKYLEAKRVFKRASYMSIFIVATGISLVLVLQSIFGGKAIFSRMLGMEGLVCMSIYFLLLSRMSNLATYTRCYLDEPLVFVFLAMNILMPLTLVLFGLTFSANVGLFILVIFHVPFYFIVEYSVRRFERKYV